MSTVTAAPSIRSGEPPTLVAHRRLARIGTAWALSYVPIHAYWALGGLSSTIGIDAAASTPAFRLTNVAASVIIATAAPVCLSLVWPRAAVVPRALRAGLAYLGGGFALLHWALFSVVGVLELTGTLGGRLRPTDRAFVWWNLGYFELWFGVMAAVLIVLARRTRQPGHRPSTPALIGTAVGLVGAAVVVWGTFTFTVWLYAGVGVPLLALAAVVLVRARTSR